MSKVTGLGRLTVGLDGTTLVERNLAVVASAAGSGAVFYFCARELALYVCGVDAGFGGCEGVELVGVFVRWVGKEDILERPTLWPLVALSLLRSCSAFLAISLTLVFLYSADIVMCVG